LHSLLFFREGEEREGWGDAGGSRVALAIRRRMVENTFVEHYTTQPIYYVKREGD
jgi:hypothetical protein